MDQLCALIRQKNKIQNMMKYNICYKLNNLSVIIKSEMDYEDIIKLQEQSPIYSTGNNSNSLKQCMAAFYISDSDFDRREPHQEFNNNQNLSFEQAIDYVQNYVDLIDTPVEDIINCLDRLQCAQDLDRILLKKKILKRKNFLKRYRAKNRQPKSSLTCEVYPASISTNGIETEAEIKKKRNRVSAQISRDRKKQYFKQLETKNLKLQEQIIRTRLENQKLKKQIQGTDTHPKNRYFSQAFNNKLTKLLILLGIICLIGMLKQTFISTTQSISKFKSSYKFEQINQLPPNEQTKLIQEGQRKVSQFLEDKQLEEQLFGTEQRKASSEIQFIGSQRNRPKQHLYQNLIQKLADMKQNLEMKAN